MLSTFAGRINVRLPDHKAVLRHEIVVIADEQKVVVGIFPDRAPGQSQDLPFLREIIRVVRSPLCSPKRLSCLLSLMLRNFWYFTGTMLRSVARHLEQPDFLAGRTLVCAMLVAPVVSIRSMLRYTDVEMPRPKPAPLSRARTRNLWLLSACTCTRAVTAGTAAAMCSDPGTGEVAMTYSAVRLAGLCETS